MADYFIGEWNGHKIEVENTLKETLKIDGKVVDETKVGIRFGVLLKAEMPDTDGLMCYVLLDGGFSMKVYCIIGKKLDATYDKELKTFNAEYEGKTITAINNGNGVLRINGEEVARDKDGLHFSCLSVAPADENGKHIIAMFDGISKFRLNVEVTLFADAETPKMVQYIKDKEGKLVPITEAGGKVFKVIEKDKES
ncbi:MAG TPA: hypothetical protein DCG49_03645 [Ruminococcus sp.]|nr:hypothetical protein [Ruminococcus sp.]